MKRSISDFSPVAIVGVGLIGGSLAQAFRRMGDVEIIGISSPATVAAALDQRVIDTGGGYEELERLIPAARTVFLCTPIQRIIEMLPAVGRAARRGALITDVGSTKAEIVEAARSAMPEGVTFLGGHPMAGSEQSGLNASDPFLFQNAMYALTPMDTTPIEELERLAWLVGELGARVVVLEPSVHDRVAAAVSHVPQLLSLALVELVGDRNIEEPAHLQMAAGGFRDMTRIASSPYRMWRDILATNTDAVRDALADLRARLSEMERDLSGQMEDHFASANRTRGAIPKDSKGFLASMFDVLVRCEDKPGVLARITNVLADAGVDIKDIELLKIREGEGGTFRLAFRDSESAAYAVKLLNGAGFSAAAL